MHRNGLDAQETVNSGFSSWRITGERQGHIQEWLSLFVFTFLHAVSILFMIMYHLISLKKCNSKKKKPRRPRSDCYLDAKKRAGYIEVQVHYTFDKLFLDLLKIFRPFLLWSYMAQIIYKSLNAGTISYFPTDLVTYPPTPTNAEKFGSGFLAAESHRPLQPTLCPHQFPRA